MCVGINFESKFISTSLLTDSKQNYYMKINNNIVLSVLIISYLYSFQNFSQLNNSSSEQKATITETQKSLYTYGFSDPNPVALIGHIYPYFRFDGYTDKGVMKNWKFVELENQFIKVSITPEIGGKIWGAYEKSTNFPFVYFNNSVKFRDVSMRGPFTSGGIEMNFGDIGHDPTTASPVDYFNRTNSDGSVSCFVGAYDWASRTRWVVEVNLPKDKAYFSTKSRWFNASPLDQTNYHWMNAGFKSSGDLEFTFPGTNSIGHGGELDKWPINKDGKQIDFYEKNNFGSYKSYHIMGKPADYYGGYWHKNQVGFVHCSPFYEKLGRKIWIWGHSRQGMMWENLLTDTDGQYVELQSGRLFNQAGESSDQSPFKHVAFEPYAADSWTERWYPVKNTGGISEGASWGAWKITRNKDWLVLAISPAEAISDTLTYLNNGKKISRFMAFQPMVLFKDSIKIVDKTEVNIAFGNKVLFTTKPDDKDIERPFETPKDFDWESEYGQFLKAKGLANQRKYVEAEEKFEKLLSKNKHHVPALGEMAQLNYRKGLYNETINFAKRALAINTYDPLANYLLGLATYRTDNLTAAKDAFSVAVLTQQYRAASLTELAKIAILEKDFSKAEKVLEQALNTNTKNEHAKHLQLIVFRKTNRKNEALQMIDELLNDNPLDHLARAERYLLTKNEADKSTFVNTIRNELPHENFIEMALWYREFKDNAAATDVISLAPNQTMVKLWAGEILQNAQLTKEGLMMSPNFVFPFRHEEEVLLKGLIAKTPSDDNSWKLNYYYGLLLWQWNRLKEAENQFTTCGEKPDFVPFYLAKAQLFEKENTIVQTALEKAHNLSPNDWRASKKLAEFYAKNNNLTKALEINEKTLRINTHEIYILNEQKASLLEQAGRYSEAIEVLKKLNVLPSEIAPFTHDLFRKANLKYAIELIKTKKNKEAIKYLEQSKTWPESLGSGKPYEVDDRLADALGEYLKDKNMEKLKEATQKLDKKDEAILALFTGK